MVLGGLLGILDRVHEVAGLGVGGLDVAFEDVLEGDLAAVPLFGGIVVLLEFGTVQRGSDEGAFGGGVGEDSGFVSGVGGGGAANGTGGGGNVGAELDVSFKQVGHALIIHDEHDEVGALTADLRSPAHAGNGERCGSAPHVVGVLAGGDAGSVLAADDEGSFDELGDHGDALGAFEDVVGHALIGRGAGEVLDSFGGALKLRAAV